MGFGLPGLLFALILPCCFQGGVRWCLAQEHAEPLKELAGPSVFSGCFGEGGWTERTICVFFFSGCRLHKKSPEDHQKILQVNDNIVWGTDWYLYDHICLYLEHFRSKHRITYICICNCTRRYLYESRSWVWVPIGMCYIQPEAPKGNCF